MLRMTTHQDTAQRTLLLSLVRGQFGGVVGVRVPPTAQLSSFLFSLLHLLHVSSDAFVVLRREAERDNMQPYSLTLIP